MHKPVILVTPDFEDESYFLKRAYADAVLGAGGLPWIAAYGSPVDELLERAKAVVVTGGAFDIAPEAYGESRSNACGPAKDERTQFEWALLQGALQRRLPLLGICGGMQLLNVVRGGTLHQDIAAELPHAGPHEQKTPKHELFHSIRVKERSRLASHLAAGGPAAVNSTHHQAVKKLGEGLIATAHSEDGVVEAIEDPSAWIVGVQWHPELIGEAAAWNREIFTDFVRAARG